MKARVPLVAVAALLAASAPAGAAERVVERGIVQSIDSTTIVLRALDGTDVAVRLGPVTRFRLNGRPRRSRTSTPASLQRSSHRPGARPRRPCLRRRRAGRGARRGAADRFPRAARPTRVGRSVRIAMNARTTVGTVACASVLRAVRPGMRVDVYRAPAAVARVIVIRSGRRMKRGGTILLVEDEADIASLVAPLPRAGRLPRDLGDAGDGRPAGPSSSTTSASRS